MTASQFALKFFISLLIAAVVYVVLGLFPEMQAHKTAQFWLAVAAGVFAFFCVRVPKPKV